ncbi:MAG TPA: hypothetical protein VHD56_11360 [Tepidisphaeraceae bacterium]|nr:hypothetical protein [Tepidisphaeraceae bacterium]
MRLSLIAACSLVLLLAGCFDWKHDVNLHGVNFQTARVAENGKVIGTIATDTVINGHPCRAGWLHLHANGAVAAFTASQDVALPRFTIPAGTWVIQDANSNVTVCAFPRNVEIQGKLCRGTGGPEGMQVSFYASGALKQFFAPEPVRIDGIPCQRGGKGIHLHENGKLRSATLSEDATIDGKLFHAGDEIRLSEAGRLN